MTPSQHKTQAESLLTLATTEGRLVSDADFTEIAAHAELARALGSGAHYAAAETALTSATAQKNAPGSGVGFSDAARVALAHAQLADR